MAETLYQEVQRIMHVSAAKAGGIGFDLAADSSVCQKRGRAGGRFSMPEETQRRSHGREMDMERRRRECRQRRRCAMAGVVWNELAYLTF